MHIPFAFSKARMADPPLTTTLKTEGLFCFEGVASHILMPHQISNLTLKVFYKGFQMRYHLYLNFNGKAVKTIKPFSENQLCGIIYPGVFICIALCKLYVDPILFCVDFV